MGTKQQGITCIHRDVSLIKLKVVDNVYWNR